MTPSHRIKEMQEVIDRWQTRAEEAEDELARRNEAAGKPVYQMRLLDGGENDDQWVEVTAQEYETPTTEKYGKWERRKLYLA